VELGHHLPTHQRPGCVALPLPGDRRLEANIVVWDLADREEAQIVDDLVSRVCLRECISKGRPRSLIFHSDNGNAMRAATLDSRLEELSVLRSFSRPRVSNDNPYSEPLFRTVKFRPVNPRRPFTSNEQACN
jgi:putative transposase